MPCPPTAVAGSAVEAKQILPTVHGLKPDLFRERTPWVAGPRRRGSGPLEPDEPQHDKDEILERGEALLRDSRALLAELDEVLSLDDATTPTAR